MNAATGRPGPTALQYVFYLAAALLILISVLFFVHYTIHPIFSFTAGDGGFIPVPTNDVKAKAFMDKPAYDLSANFLNFPCYNYTLAFDVNINSPFPPSAANEKEPTVILYRSKSRKATPFGITDANPIQTALQTLTQSNLIVWFEPLSNDMNVGVILTKTGESNQFIRLTVENLPINKPFRVGIVFSAQRLEIYVNGKLQQTTNFPVGYTPPVPPADAGLFATTTNPGSLIKVGKLYFWDDFLLPTQMKANGIPLSDATFFA
jgi:hypothetical protein